MSAKAYFDDDGYYCAEFIDNEGQRLPFEPRTGKQQNILLILTEKYGDNLKGIIKDTESMKMQLFVEMKDEELL